MEILTDINYSVAGGWCSIIHEKDIWDKESCVINHHLQYNLTT